MLLAVDIYRKMTYDKPRCICEKLHFTETTIAISKEEKYELRTEKEIRV